MRDFISCTIRLLELNDICIFDSKYGCNSDNWLHITGDGTIQPFIFMDWLWMLVSGDGVTQTHSFLEYFSWRKGYNWYETLKFDSPSWFPRSSATWKELRNSRYIVVLSRKRRTSSGGLNLHMNAFLNAITRFDASSLFEQINFKGRGFLDDELPSLIIFCSVNWIIDTEFNVLVNSWLSSETLRDLCRPVYY